MKKVCDSISFAWSWAHCWGSCPDEIAFQIGSYRFHLKGNFIHFMLRMKIYIYSFRINPSKGNVSIEARLNSRSKENINFTCICLKFENLLRWRGRGEEWRKFRNCFEKVDWKNRSHEEFERERKLLHWSCCRSLKHLRNVVKRQKFGLASSSGVELFGQEGGEGGAKGGGQEEEEEYRIISDVSEMWNDGYLISADVAGVACNGGERLGNSSLVHWFGGWHQDGSVGLVFDWFDLALWVNDYRAWALCDGCRNGQPDPPDSDWFLLLLLFFSQRWNCCLVLLWYIFFWLHLLLFVLLPHLHLDVGLVQGPWQQSSTSMTIDYRCSDVGNCCSPQQPTQYS